MKHNILSSTDIKVSRACLGTMSFGAHVDEETSFQILDRAFDLGVNFLDTAELYAVPVSAETYGLTEEIIGKWLKRSGKRSEVVLATKIAGPGIKWIRNGETKFDRKNIISAVEGSLKRLGTDYIDLYQLHWPTRAVSKFGDRYFPAKNQELSVNFEETLEVLDELQKSGKVRRVGVSNETPWGTMKWLQVAKEKNLPRMVSIQNNYSLLTRTFDVALSEVSQAENIGLLAYSPLGFGVLGGRYLDGNKPANGRFTEYPDFNPRYRSAQVEQSIKRYKKLAEDFDLSLVELALGFVYQQPFLTSNIIGPSSVQQLEECVKAESLEFSEELFQKINEIDSVFPNPVS